MIKSLLKITGNTVGNIARMVYAVYRVVAIAIGTIMMFGWSLLLFKDYADRYVSLPNGFQMVPQYYDSGGVLLLDRDGTAVVTYVEAITWCNDVIYGRRSEVADHHPFMSCGVESDCEIQVDYMFLYDSEARTLQQYETNVFHVIKQRDGERSQGIFSEEEKLKFDNEIKKRNLPAFDYGNAVDYSSMIQGDSAVPEGELCRTSDGR